MPTPTSFDEDLVSGTEVAARCGNPASTDLPYFVRLGRAASAAVSRHCRRRFRMIDHEETVSGTGGVLLRVNHWPIAVDLQSSHGGTGGVWIDQFRRFSGAPLRESIAGTSSGTDYLVHEGEEGKGMLEALSYGWWPRGARNILVRYAAGYTYVPIDVKEACLGLAEKWHTSDMTAGSGMLARQQTAGGASLSYGTAPLPPTVAALLARYRRASQTLAIGASIGEVNVGGFGAY